MLATSGRTETMLKRIDSYIGGADVPPADGAYLDKIDPRTGAKMGETADGGAAEVERAMAAASAAFPAWRDMRPAARGRILVELARRIRGAEDRLGAIERAE